MDRSCGLRDLVPAVDHLSTREALELELAFTACKPPHSPVGGGSGLESKFASSGVSGVHFYSYRLVVVGCVLYPTH